MTGRKLSNISDVISYIEAIYLILDNDGIWIHQGKSFPAEYLFTMKHI